MIPGGTHVNHRLTDSDAWYVITDVPDGLKHFVRKKIMRKIEGDFNSGNMRYQVSRAVFVRVVEPARRVLFARRVVLTLG